MITLPDDVADALNDGLGNTRDDVLPFPVLYASWVNGDERMEEFGGTRYYGGWDIDKEKADEVFEKWGVSVPETWKIEKRNSTKEQGKKYEVYTFRNLIVAPIATRMAFKDRQSGKLTANFVKGGTNSKLNVLAMLGITTSETEISALGPVILTRLEGYQSGYVQKAMQGWVDHTARARNEFAPNVPAWAFYMAIGTFGQDFQGEAKGPKGSQTVITPIKFGTKAIDEALLTKLFVGEDVARQMIDLKLQAKEWIKAWSAEGLAAMEAAQTQAPAPGDAQDPAADADEAPFAMNFPVSSSQNGDSDPVIQRGMPLEKALEMTVPSGMAYAGSSLDVVVKDPMVGAMIIDFLCGDVPSPGGQRFDPKSVPDGNELQIAARVIKQHAAGQPV